MCRHFPYSLITMVSQKITGLKEMSPEEMDAALILMDPDLRHQLQKEGVAKHCIAVLAEAGFTNSKTFRCFSPSMDAFPDRVKVMGLKPDADLIAMAQTQKCRSYGQIAKRTRLLMNRRGLKRKGLALLPHQNRRTTPY